MPKLGAAVLERAQAPALLCREAKPRFVKPQRLEAAPRGSGVAQAGVPRTVNGGCCCLRQLETARPAGALGAAQRRGTGCHWEGAVTVGPEATAGNVQAGVCFAKVITALVIQQMQRGLKTLTRNARRGWQRGWGGRAARWCGAGTFT